MKLRNLGRSNLKVAPLIFGGNVFGWTVDEAMSFSLLDAWLDAGFNSVDTADVYSRWAQGHQGGESEQMIGKWLKASGKRDKIMIATKVGKSMGEGLQGLSAGYIKQAVEASLRRLQTDYIDLYFSHEDDKTTPLEETMQAFANLIQEGKVRVIGASNYSAERFLEALDVSKQLGIPRYECIQPGYNLCDREEFESGMQVLCIKKEVGVVNYFALAAGFLSGKYRNESDLQGHARAANINPEYFKARGMRILDALDKVADDLDATPAAVTLAWELAQPGITAPIVSATTLEQMAEFSKAVTMELNEGALALLNKASDWPK